MKHESMYDRKIRAFLLEGLLNGELTSPTAAGADLAAGADFVIGTVPGTNTRESGACIQPLLVNVAIQR